MGSHKSVLADAKHVLRVTWQLPQRDLFPITTQNGRKRAHITSKEFDVMLIQPDIVCIWDYIVYRRFGFGCESHTHDTFQLSQREFSRRRRIPEPSSHAYHQKKVTAYMYVKECVFVGQTSEPRDDGVLVDGRDMVKLYRHQTSLVVNRHDTWTHFTFFLAEDKIYALL